MPLPIIKRKVQEVCPEILEKRVVVHGCPDCTGDEWASATDYDDTDDCPTVGCEREEAVKIYPGSEIRLSHILRTIREICPEKVWMVDLEGEFFDQSPSDGSPISLEAKWDMEHDSLDWHAIHRPETVAFIGGLIK